MAEIIILNCADSFLLPFVRLFFVYLGIWRFPLLIILSLLFVCNMEYGKTDSICFRGIIYIGSFQLFLSLKQKFI